MRTTLALTGACLWMALLAAPASLGAAAGSREGAPSDLRHATDGEQSEEGFS